MFQNNKISLCFLIVCAAILFFSCGENEYSVFDAQDIPENEIEKVVNYQMAKVEEALVKVSDKTYSDLKFDINEEGILVRFSKGILVAGFDLDEEKPTGELAVIMDETLTLNKIDDISFEEAMKKAFKGIDLNVREKDGNWIISGEITDPEKNEKLSVETILNGECIGLGSTEIEVKGDQAVLMGTLGTISYVQIKDLIEKNPAVKTLVLKNVPGSLNDAINVHTGRLVREAGLTTMVPADGEIASGGVDLFLAGSKRIVEEGGRLGVHSWCCSEGKPANELPQDHPAHIALIKYSTKMLRDYGKGFYFFTLTAAPFEGIHWMSREEMVKWNLISE